MPFATINSFVDGVLQSQLLDAEQCDELQRLPESIGDTRELAHELLKRGWLTAYQVNQILQGKGAGLVLGPFILLERIGEGGMGQVFKARQKMLNRVVALKVIRKQCLANPKVTLRFLREIRAAGQLSHPHIVRAYDADQINGTYYIAMEYIEGVDLANLVKDEGPLAVDRACEYIRQAALGLQHAFERGMVHRDIKPANLLVARAIASDRRRSSGMIQRLLNLPPLPPSAQASAAKRLPSPLAGEGPGVRGELKRSSSVLPRAELTQHYPWGVIKILDMGLARYTDPFTGHASTHLTQVGSVMGTPEYIAPEQARDSHSSDIRADLYSLGCTLYFLLTGQPPFPKGTLTEKLLQHQFEVAEPVAQVRHEQLRTWQGPNGPANLSESMLHVPKPVVKLLYRLLAKQPSERYQTPIELANELQTVLQQLASHGQEEDLEKTAPIDMIQPMAESVTVDQPATVVRPIVLLSAKPPPRFVAGKLAVVLATLGAILVVSFLTLVGVLMSGSNPMRAHTKNLDVPKSKLKSEDGKAKR